MRLETWERTMIIFDPLTQTWPFQYVNAKI